MRVRDDIHMMSVSEILRKAISSVDFHDFRGRPADWMEVIQHKGTDTGFDTLVDSILDNGWEENSAIGFYDGEITEGHHRLVAAILLGIDEVPVHSWGSSPGTIDAHHYGRTLRHEYFDHNDMKAAI